MENCEFSLASTLVAGRVLISTCYKFPLEKEIIIKIDGRKVLVMVKDEGWIDEVEDDDAGDNEESSLFSSEEGDRWGDDPSDINSVNSLPENVEWEDDDRDLDQIAGPQQVWNPGKDASLPKEGTGPGVEKANYGAGNLGGDVRKLNSLHEIKILEGTCSDEVVSKAQSHTGEMSHSVRPNDNAFGLRLDTAQVLTKEAQGKENEFEKSDKEMVDAEAQLENTLNYEGKETPEAHILNTQKLDGDFVDVE
ncbi:hypothetical protein L1887_44423 [Cichorium endivia]|nr:hypothetical protein L1887_44423 [Cichorium endivia]